MIPNNLTTIFIETVERLETPQIMVIFLFLTAATFYIVHKIGRRHLKKDIHKAVNLLISVIIGLILIAVSTGLGLL